MVIRFYYYANSSTEAAVNDDFINNTMVYGSSSSSTLAMNEGQHVFAAVSCKTRVCHKAVKMYRPATVV